MGNPVSDVAGAVTAVATVIDHAAERQAQRDETLLAAAEQLAAPLPDPAPDPSDPKPAPKKEAP